MRPFDAGSWGICRNEAQRRTAGSPTDVTNTVERVLSSDLAPSFIPTGFNIMEAFVSDGLTVFVEVLPTGTKTESGPSLSPSPFLVRETDLRGCDNHDCIWGNAFQHDGALPRSVCALPNGLRHRCGQDGP